MNQQEVTKLVTYIEENLRSSPSSGLKFVDTRNFRTRLLSKQNHVVFGRRGAGKTSLVNSLTGNINNLNINLNLEDYKDITFPNIVIYILIEMFAQLGEKIKYTYPWYKFNFKAVKCRKKIKTECSLLKNHLHEPDEETQEVHTNESYKEEMSANLKNQSASAGAKTVRDKSKQVKRNLPKCKIDYLRIELTKYKKLLLLISSLFSNQPIFLVFDDFYFVAKDSQPFLVDYFHRLTKGTALYLKIATIKHRSKLYSRVSGNYIGVELGHDMFEVNMDYTLDSFDELQEFMRQLLDNAIENSNSDLVLEEIFAGDGFSQLCLASGGVPRDFLSLFVILANKTLNAGQLIGKVQVTTEAISNIANKLESMKKDTGDEDHILESYLYQIKRYVYDNKRTNAFLISKDEIDRNIQIKQVIRELVDLRLIHLIDHNTSKAPSDGRRYEAYILDIGLYDNSRPRKFSQIEPGQRDDKARKDALRASPLFELNLLTEPIGDQILRTRSQKSKLDNPVTLLNYSPKQLELSFE